MVPTVPPEDGEGAGELRPLADRDAFDIDFGTVVFVEGADDPAIVYVEQGELSVYAGDFEVASLARGSVIGLEQVLGDPMWPYSVRAVRQSTLKQIDRLGYKALIGRSAWTIERAAVATLAQCLREIDLRIAARSNGFVATFVPDDSGVFDRWRLRRRMQTAVGEVNLPRALAATTGFADASPDVVAALAADMHAVAFEPGHALFHEGVDAEHVYILVNGVVLVLKATHDDRVEELGSLEAGALIGVTAAVQNRAHSASCVAEEPVIALAIDAARWRALCDGDLAGGSAVRRATVRALGDMFAGACARMLVVADQRRREIRQELVEGPHEDRDHSRRYYD